MYNITQPQFSPPKSKFHRPTFNDRIKDVEFMQTIKYWPYKENFFNRLQLLQQNWRVKMKEKIGLFISDDEIITPEVKYVVCCHWKECAGTLSRYNR